MIAVSLIIVHNSLHSPGRIDVSFEEALISGPGRLTTIGTAL
jgi:hypothetical protein